MNLLTLKERLLKYSEKIGLQVEEEKAEAALHKISGIVSEISGKSMLLSVDSADAFRFKVTNDTIIDGKADNVEVGDHNILAALLEHHREIHCDVRLAAAVMPGHKR